MAQQLIGIGAAPNDGTGDPARTAFDKVNDNFTELYSISSVEGLFGNGTSDDRAGLAAADVALGVGEALTLAPGTYLVNSNLTISHVVQFRPGAKIKPASGVTITLSKGYYAGDFQHVFDLSAAGTISAPQVAGGYFTPWHFGAVADLVTDDLAAFNAAHDALPADGGAIFVPKGGYRLSAAFNLTKYVYLFGEGGMHGNTATRMPTRLVFDASKNGIIVNRHNTINDTTVAAFTYPGADWSVVERMELTSNGGSGSFSGLWMRAKATFQQLTVNGFPQYGVKIVATIGGGGALEGAANLWRMDMVRCTNNGSDGFFVDGADSNGGLGTVLDATLNGGWGFFDSSFLGDTYVQCHAASNVSGPYKTDDANARNVLLGCYSEQDQPPSSLVSPTVVIGGLHGAGFTAGSDAFIAEGGSNGLLAARSPYAHQNTKNPTTIYSAMGQGDTSDTALMWGSSDDSEGRQAHRVQYVASGAHAGWWRLVHGGLDTRVMMRWPGSVAAPRVYAPILPNGVYFVGVDGFPANAALFNTATAKPSSGTMKQGDTTLNVSSAIGSPDFWKCTVAGAPGTVVANKKSGTFTCAAAATTTVNDTEVTATSTILLMPTNAAAATLIGSVASLYVSARTAGVSFAVTTAAGTPAGGTETFAYIILN